MNELNESESVTQIDLELTDLYSSWFDLGAGEDFSEIQTESVFLHFRMAFIMGASAQLAALTPLMDRLTDIL